METKEQAREKYLAFMLDAKNIKNCKNCPENEERKGVNQLPCGQYNCWVRLHCQKGGNK